MFKGSYDDTKPQLLEFSDSKDLKDKMHPGFFSFFEDIILC